ncbi:MAG: DUF2807 domain-containing protein [Bacteroidetes bacterium]|nr:MAG: DUF2807 domain-containing protein [Bacteroidota bacterium]
MRYLILFMILVGFFMFANRSCGGFPFGFGIKGEGPLKTETRSTPEFHAVLAQVPGDTEVRVADRYSVEVQAQENLLSILKTEVKNGKLEIYFDESVSSCEGLRILVTAPAYDELAVLGSGHLEAKSPISSEFLELTISGSGELNVPETNVEKLDCNISGSGDMSIGGMAKQANYDIAGSGDIDAKNLVSDRGKATISGSGTINCNYSEQLDASIAGSGDIYYRGSAAVKSNISGSGSVEKRD